MGCTILIASCLCTNHCERSETDGIQTKHETAALKPELPADERMLIRGAYLDLVGLPSTQELS